MTEHEQAIVALCASDPELRRKGFRKAVLDKWGWDDSTPRHMLKGGRWEVPNGKLFARDDMERDLGIRPDAWKIVGEDQVHCYEVAHTSILTTNRRITYGSLWFAFDTFYLTLRLFSCDTITKPVEIDLRDWWGRYTMADAKP